MATQVQFRGGSTAQNNAFTGASKELTVDTDKDVVVVHDGSTPGGHPLMAEDRSNSSLANGSVTDPALKFASGQTGIYSPGSGQVAIATNGGGRLFVNAAGSVGINEASPTATLHVKGTAKIGPADASTTYQGMSLINGKDSSASTTTSFFDFKNNLETPDAHFFAEHHTNGGSRLILGTTPAGDRTTDRRQTRIRILEDGKVAVGDITPTANLEVAGADDSDNFIVSSGGTNFAVYHDATVGEVRLKAEDGTTNNYGKYLTFWTQLGGNSASERMRIGSNGKIGINAGTEGLAGQLEVRHPDGIVSRSDATQATNTNKAFRGRNNSDVDTFSVSYQGAGYFGADLDVAGDGRFGPKNTTSQYQGVSLANGKDSSSAATVSFIDFKTNQGQADSHVFSHHLTDNRRRIDYLIRVGSQIK